MNTKQLHAAIMNLPCETPRFGPADSDARNAYNHGHFDARHAAAELVAANRENVNAKLLEACKELLAVYNAVSLLVPVESMLEFCRNGIPGIADDFEGRAEAAIARAESGQSDV
jgi:hypothetical protein